MSNPFQQCQAIEAEGLSELKEFLRLRSECGQWVLVDKSQLGMLLQREHGDALVNDQAGMVSVEIKVERVHTGNLYLETWSNAHFDRRNPGWMVTSKAQVLLCYFLDKKVVYGIPFRNLWEWFFVAGNIGRSGKSIKPARPQLNLTLGHLVPIRTVSLDVGLRKWRRTAEGKWGEVNDEYTPKWRGSGFGLQAIDKGQIFYK